MFYGFDDLFGCHPGLLLVCCVHACDRAVAHAARIRSACDGSGCSACQAVSGPSLAVQDLLSVFLPFPAGPGLCGVCRLHTPQFVTRALARSCIMFCFVVRRCLRVGVFCAALLC